MQREVTVRTTLNWRDSVPIDWAIAKIILRTVLFAIVGLLAPILIGIYGLFIKPGGQWSFLTQCAIAVGGVLYAMYFAHEASWRVRLERDTLRQYACERKDANISETYA